ncbi:choline ABC transporter substrate-binding protein [Halomonas citrativorans]|uniref:Choline ABC transporter substrate-binding protein n=1 Tax=Halomonas citrativorans TaxID=2742612 RepID=A0ABR9F6Y2_9GAMM|nr:choline ABC transporter substrate-binding protein [Halomonas citrativorans]MBE0402242.1 choline ABC transporter substrate-binding protein [Halomonas citrativorans]
MKRVQVVGLSAFMLGAAMPMMAQADECSRVRFAEVGWTDITATTALASEVLEALGYEPTVDTVSVPIAYAGMRNNDFDVFLGNWMPSMASISDPYIESGDVERLVVNLEGAKYTLAVPQYVYDAGVTSVNDLAAHADQFNHRVHGIEAGNDGNELIQQMIDDNAYDLGDWQVVDSSEAGMLSELTTRVPNEEWMVFLGWEPHPMNTNFDMAYLSDADDYFGPDLGGATVHTNTRAGFVEACPNVGTLLGNMTFTLEMENQLMGAIMNDGVDPRVAANRYLKEHGDLLETWLEGVTTLDGEPALPAVQAAL